MQEQSKKSSGEVWNERYAGDGYLFGKEPSLVVKNFVEILKVGKALEIAMGEGRNSVFLASRGFEVQGVDGSSVAIEKARRLAEEKNVQVDAKVQNLDFFLMPLMKFDTIVMTYYRPQARFFSEIRRGLVKNGTFILEAYTVEQYKNNPPAQLDFDQCFKPNEVLSNLKDLQVLYYKEIPDGANHTVQLVAKKVMV